MKNALSVAEAVRILARGDVCAIPTETVYGLAGRVDSDDALKKIFSTKERPFFDPLIVHLSTIDDLETYTTQVSDELKTFLCLFWPGPLTIVAQKTEAVSSLITSGFDSVGLRIPAHPLARQVIKELGVAVAAPSANRFGKTSPTRAEHVVSEFFGQVPVLDGGPCQVGIESTVARWNQIQNSIHIEILRPGVIGAEQIKNQAQANGLRIDVSYTSAPVAPGQMRDHYQPETPVILCDRWPLTPNEITEIAKELKLSTIKTISEIHVQDDATTFARELYHLLREHSGHKTDVIAVIWNPKFNEREEWTPIFNRLWRAAKIHRLALPGASEPV